MNRSVPPEADEAKLVEWVAPASEKRGRGRPRKTEIKMLDTDGDPIRKDAMGAPKVDPNDPEEVAHLESLNVRAASLTGGVNISWLATAFRIETKTARKRIAGLKPIGFGTRGEEIYDFLDAASYLAPPQRDKFARWIGTLRTSDLPTQLQDSYWAAMRKRQIWEQNAGELWKTDDVAELLGDVFKMLKSNMQLWTDNIDANGDLPGDQRDKLTQMVDGLQNDLYQSLVDLPMKRHTPSSLYDPEIVTNNLDEDEEDLIG